MSAHHELMGGKLHVYKRQNSRFWQCSTFLGNHNHRVSTKRESLQEALDFAEDWYLELRGKHKRGEIGGGKTLRQAAEHFLREYEIITEGQRNKICRRSRTEVEAFISSPSSATRLSGK